MTAAKRLETDAVKRPPPVLNCRGGFATDAESAAAPRPTRPPRSKRGPVWRHRLFLLCALRLWGGRLDAGLWGAGLLGVVGRPVPSRKCRLWRETPGNEPNVRPRSAAS